MSRLTTREIAAAALFAALMAVSAFVAVPVGSVPFTLQVYVVLLTGLVLGARVGALSVLAYLILGLLRARLRGRRVGPGRAVRTDRGLPARLRRGGDRRRASSPAPASGRCRDCCSPAWPGSCRSTRSGATWLALQLDLTPGAAVLTGVVPFVWLDVLKAVAAALTARALVSLPLGLPAATRRGR